MKKSGLLSKYEHQLTLKNYSENTLKAYPNGLNIFLEYVKLNQVRKITPIESAYLFRNLSERSTASLQTHNHNPF